MAVLIVIIIVLTAAAVLEGIALKNLLGEYQRKEVKEELLEGIIAERFMEHGENINNRKF